MKIQKIYIYIYFFFFFLGGGGGGGGQGRCERRSEVFVCFFFGGGEIRVDVNGGEVF